ncbi:MAG: type II CAAX endopeptidase family protein [Wenzhouxiangella sp.]|jgi:membrane protease YdiL (CAAX protease family)|nr:type II CAAX endopeptidase family protein [Wenzhouxiangella sp.]
MTTVLTQPSTQQTSLVKRAARSFAQAGLEISQTIGFFVLGLILVILVESLGFSTNLARLTMSITMNAWEHEPDRLARAEAFLDAKLPDQSDYRVYEIAAPENSDFQQTLVAEIELRQLSAQFTANEIFFDLSDAVIGVRGAANSETLSFEGPGFLAGALALHLVLLPWLAIRLRFMPANSPTARPLLPPELNMRRALGLGVTAGFALGVLIPLTSTVAEAAGLLGFSDRMPSAENLGITRELLWLAAGMIALAGAAEEVFFRGVLLRRFVQNGLPHLGVVVCAFWFTLLHFAYFSWDSGNIVYMLVIASAGLGLGFLTLRTRTWVPAAIVHASYNFTVTLVAGWSLL